MVRHYWKIVVVLLVILTALFTAGAALASQDAHETAPAAAAATGHEASHEAPVVPPAPASTVPWWVWPLALFVTTFILGILAVLGGVGGGVLFVPIVGGFFPFNIDFVRGAGLMVALDRKSTRL